MLSESRSPATEAPRRPTVRIVRRRLPPAAALISLSITAVAAIIAFVAWRVWREDEPLAGPERTLAGMVLTHRCEQGHRPFEAGAQIDHRTCTQCGQPAYPVTRYHCPTHGDQAVLVQFTLDELGEPAVARVRALAGGDWAAVELGVECPLCNEPMTYESKDSIDFKRFKKREGEGSPRKPVATGERPPRDAQQTDPHPP